METRAIFIYWSVATEEPQRLLDDLARWTDINTIILGSPFFVWGEPERGAQLVLPSAEPFGDLPVPVVTGAEFDSLLRFVDTAKANGFKVSCNISPLGPNIRGLTSLSRVDVTDRPTVAEDLMGHGCPNNPDIVRYAETLARETVASWTSLDMLDLNHVEYPLWPRPGLRMMFVCFCRFCRARAEDEGIDFDEMQLEVASVYDSLTTASAGPDTLSGLSPNGLLNHLARRPLVATWLSFRVASVSTFTRRIAEAAREVARRHNPSLRLGIGSYLPSVSRLFGTDFASLHALFDWVAPKFPDYVTGTIIPMIADQVASRTGRWEAEELRPVIRELYDVGPGPEEYAPIASPQEDLLYSNTFDASIIDRQMRHLEPLKGQVPMYPWVWLYNHDLEHLREKIDTLKRHGFDGYFLWPWPSDLTAEALKAAKGIF